jgi:RNA polymerase sigma-70 factor (ECF subfamily)
MVRERELAEDLAQETFVRMVTALDRYRPELSFSPWLLRIANNAAIDHLRRRRLDTVALDGWPDAAGPGARAIQPAERSESTPARVDPGALRAALEHAIGRLREQYRRCIVLRHMEERSYDDIAEIMDLPVGTVKTYLHRARNELKQMLGHLRDGSGPGAAVAKRET